MHDPRRPGLVSLETIVKGWDYWVIPEAAAAVERGLKAEVERLRGSRVLVLLDWSELAYDGLLEGLRIDSGHVDVRLATNEAGRVAAARFESMLARQQWKNVAADRQPLAPRGPDASDGSVHVVYNRRAWDGVGWHALEVRARLWSCDPDHPINSALIALLRANYRDSEVMRYFEGALDAPNAEQRKHESE
jgi:hypothetical protein